MREPDPRTRAVAMIVAFLHVTRWFLWVFFQPGKGHGGSYDNRSAGGRFWKPLWVHGAAGTSGCSVCGLRPECLWPGSVGALT